MQNSLKKQGFRVIKIREDVYAAIREVAKIEDRQIQGVVDRLLITSLRSKGKIINREYKIFENSEAEAV